MHELLLYRRTYLCLSQIATGRPNIINYIVLTTINGVIVLPHPSFQNRHNIDFLVLAGKDLASGHMYEA
jgi:hypothetical protein